MPLAPDLRATAEHTVTEDDTAAAVGSGSVGVLGTPVAIAWAEGATVAAVADHLEAGTTTVGTRVDVRHLQPTPPGRTVIATATVTSVDRRRLTFDVEMQDPSLDDSVVLRGTIERVVVPAGFGR